MSVSRDYVWPQGKPITFYHTYHHLHRGGKVSALFGRPKLRRRLQFGHNRVGGSQSVYGHAGGGIGGRLGPLGVVVM
jgi:hypothetical protein